MPLAIVYKYEYAQGAARWRYIIYSLDDDTPEEEDADICLI